MKRNFFCFILLFSLSSQGQTHDDEPSPDVPYRVHVLEGDQSVFGLGPTLGFPTGIGIQLGGWNLGTGGFIDGTLGYFGIGFTAELEGGYMFDRAGSLKQSIALTAGYFVGVIPLVPVTLALFQGAYAGPTYKILFWNLFFVDVGVAFAYNHTDDIVPLLGAPLGGQRFGVMPLAKLGFNWFF